MLYNKNQFRKVEDKKVLHKVKDHWVAVSLSLLMALGGTAAAGHVVHADANTANLNGQANNMNRQISSPNQQLVQPKPEIDFTNNNGEMSSDNATEQVTPAYVNSATNNIVPNNILNNDENANVITPVSTSDASNGNNSSLSALIQSLDTPANVDTYSASNNNNVITPASRHAASSSVAPVSYVSGDNGSAASYHAKASADQSAYAQNSSLAEQYVNSLNADFGSQNNSLTSAYQSAQAKYNHTQSLANSYFNIVNNSSRNYDAEIASLAASNGQNASDYVQSVSYRTSNYASAMSSASALKSQLAVVNSDAQLISDLNSNAGLKAEYQAKSVSALDAFVVASAAYANASAFSSAIASKSSAADSASFAATISSTNDYAKDMIAQINSSRDSSTVSSLAVELGYPAGDDFLIRNADTSYVDANSNGFVPGSNGAIIYSGYSGQVSSSYSASAGDNLYTLLSDTAVRNNYTSDSALNSSLARSAAGTRGSISAVMASASSAASSARVKYQSAHSASNYYHVLTSSNLNLGDLFNKNQKVSINSSVAENAVNSLADYEINSGSLSYLIPSSKRSLAQTMVSVATSAFMSREASVRSGSNAVNNGNITDAKMVLGDINSVIRDLESRVPNYLQKYHNGTVSLQDLDLDLNNSAIFNNTIPQQLEGNIVYDLYYDRNDPSISIVKNYPVHVETIKRALSYIQTHPSTITNAEGALNNVLEALANVGNGLLDPNSYAAASAAVNAFDQPDSSNTRISSNASLINSVAQSAVLNANSTASASTAYGSSAGVNYALAGSLLGSYDSLAYTDQRAASAAKNSLDDFYNQKAPGYTSASAAALSASNAAPVDAKLAQAYGMHVYNYAPKYITVIKNVDFLSGLHNSKKLGVIKQGVDRIHVNGVGFNRNGNTFYNVTYKGRVGYVTADPNVTKNSYLFAVPNNHVTVTFLRPTHVYNSPVFNKKTIIKNVSPGQQMSGVIVSEDNAYGGWTRIRTDDGHYITSNTKWIDLDFQPSVNRNTNRNAHRSNSSNVVQPQNKVNF